MAKLHDFYKDSVVAELAKQFNYKSVMQVPRIDKITLNMGLGEAVADKKVLENATADMQAIAGQKPIVTVARKSVAGFKIREGYPIGCKVTLRGERMWEFFERLVSIAIPRIRDFRGLNPKSFDGRGNFSMGVREQIIFPEIEFDKVDKIRGMDITITTSAQTDA
jgi:large subunit ribosomal protein L5